MKIANRFALNAIFTPSPSGSEMQVKQMLDPAGGGENFERRNS